MWRAGANAHWDDNQGVLPADHAELPADEPRHGPRRSLRHAGSGGTVYFAARSDLSTFLEDLALARPTQLNFVPRIWDMLYQEYVSRVDRRLPTAPTAHGRERGAGRAAPEPARRPVRHRPDRAPRPSPPS